MLCVANLSRFAQPAQLDLSEFDGMVPCRDAGLCRVPAVSRQPYPVTLAPYGFLWLELHPAPDTTTVQSDDSALLIGEPSEWKMLFENSNRRKLEDSILPGYIPRQRWFGNKSTTIRSTTIVDWGKLDSSSAIFCLVQVEYETGKADRYFVPMATAFGSAASTLRDSAAASILSAVLSPSGEGVLYDATYDIGSCQELLSVIENSTTSALQLGTVQGASSSALPGLLGGNDRAGG